MTDFSAINAASGVTQETNITSTDSSDTIGQEMFLKLLVTQMQNQDPLNPDDPTEFTSQLAQYSQLEQLTNLNDGMESLVESNTNSDKLASLNTIGKDVSFSSDTVDFSGAPVQIGYTLPDNSAAEVSITLTRDGSTVARLDGKDLSAGSHYLTWEGKYGNGMAVPSGEYEIKVLVKDGSENTSTAESLVKAEVTGVDLSGDNGGTLITTAGEIGFSSISGVFDKTTEAVTDADSSESEEDETEDSTASVTS